MKVTMLLADAAQAVEGKLYILGGGWSITGPAPTPMAIALKIEVPWNDTNTTHQLHLVLCDEDGRPVRVPTPTGEQPFEIKAEFRVGRPVDLRPGTPLDVPLALNIGPLPLRHDSRFVWRCSINDVTEDAWQVGFSTRPLPPSSPD